MINFKSLNNFGLGGATLNVNPTTNQLVVNNLSNTSLDGIGIITTGYNNFEMVIDPISFSNGKVFNISYFGIDGYNRLKVKGQHSIIQTDNQAKFCFNTQILSKTFKIKGYLNNSLNFEKSYNDPTFPPFSNWVWIVIAIGGYILSRVDYEKVTVRNSFGEITSETTKWSWNSANPGSGGTSSFQTFDGDNFTADHLYLESVVNYPAPLPSILGNELCEVQVTTNNISSFSINDYIVS